MVKKIIFFCSLSLLLATSCRKEKTTWDSDWVVPIVNDTLSLKNLVNDSTLAVDVNSFYAVDLSRTILNIGLSDILTIPDTVINQVFSLTSGTLTVPPGFNIVNQIEEHDINIPSMELKKIHVSNGIINVKVFNPLATIAFFTVKLPGVTKDGIEFSQNYAAPPGTIANPGVANATLDISDYWIDLTGEFGTDFNVLQSKLIVNSDPAGPTVTISSAQDFKVEAEFKDLKVDYARGYFGNKIVTDTTSYTIDLMQNVVSGSIDLPQTAIRFEIENGLKVSSRATITQVANMNNVANTVNLSSAQMNNPIYLNQATGSWSTLTPSTQTIEFNSSNSNVEEYIENLGVTHTVGYKIELNPYGNVSGGYDEIFPSSRLKVKLKAELPLSIGADGLTLRDTFDLDIKQDLEKTHLESGDIVLNVTNAFPFKGTVVLYLLNEQGQYMYTIYASSPIQSSLYGTVDASDNLQKQKSEVHAVLTEAMLSDLDLIKKVCLEVRLDTPDPLTSLNQQVAVPAGAFMAVKMKALFRVKAKI